MIQKNQIIERRKEIAEIRHADSVFRDIQAREKEREDYEQRWFWELLQNAKDAVNENQTVKALIEIKNDQIVFSHTGNPFELDDILSLIIQGSSKTDKKGKTGRFGTGFLTTYLLSKTVQITGQLDNNQGCFQFELDRNADNNEQFYKLQILSNDDFDNSIREESYLGDTEFQTKFVYSLDSRGKDTAKVGIQSLNELIPFAQLFNSQIKSIVVKTEESTTRYEKEFLEEITIEERKICKYKLETIINDESNKKLNAYVINGSNYEICCLTISDSDGETFHFINEKYPRLYFTFPLIGSEELGIPFVINSTEFDPKVERNGVYLKTENDKTDVAKNKDIIDEALTMASTTFAKVALHYNIKGVFELFNYKPSKDYTWVDHIWLGTLKSKLLTAISAIQCIPTNRNLKFESLDSLTIPFSSIEGQSIELWGSFNSLNSYMLPCEKELGNWIEVCENHALIREKDIFEIKSVSGIKELINIVENFYNLENLEADLVDVEWTVWINQLYSLVNRHFENFPLEKNIILNQKNLFREAEGVYWDNCKDLELNEISIKLKSDFPSKLISLSVTHFSLTGISDFSKNYAINVIKNKLNDTETDYTELDIQEASSLFLKWLIENNRVDDIRDLKILSGEDDNLSAQTLPKSTHLLLSPKTFFSKDFPRYAELIRERDCMHSIYNSTLNESDYNFLNEHGLIHYSPLVLRTEKLNPKIIELLIINPDDLNQIKDEEGKINQDIELTYSDFAYLTATEGHIYDRNSTPKSSLERFKFLLLEASEKDPLFNESPYEIRIAGSEKTILFNRSLWLSRSKNLQWIIIKNSGEETEKKFYSEAPSSKNLSELIKDSDTLIKSIKGDKQQFFLTRIGVGVSDLIRNTLSSDELKLSWDKAITNMITSDVDPELVQEIFNDPSIKKEYAKRLNERKLIDRNQKIGALIEKLFNEYINNLKSTGVAINIERKPFGSDYLLTEDSSDLVNNNFERESFIINDWLIELKATGKDYAAMTTLQAETASKNTTRYALIVVPLDGHEPDIEYLRTNSVVINNIGTRIKSVISEYDEVELKKQNLSIGKNGVSVNIEDQNVRFRIESAIWKSTDRLTIEKFILDNFSS